MPIKQGLTQELRQTQRLSPLQIQTIKLIELPIQELEAAVQKELEENPVLEEDRSSKSEEGVPQKRDVSLDEYKADDTPSWKLYVNNWGKDAKPEYNTFSVKESFTQSLQDQLGFMDLTDHQKQVANYIICSLDGAGYLRTDIQKVVDDMALRASIFTTDEEAEEMLRVIQSFEPAGVGARDLRECMLLQLRAMPEKESVKNAISILEKFYNEFTSRHFQKIVSRMGLSEEDFRKAMTRIARLNPSPGGAVDDSYNDQAQQIVPDFILTCENDNIVFDMPRFSIPELKVSKKYEAIMQAAQTDPSKETKEAAEFVKAKLNSAKWFIEAIKQRYNTLSKTMQAIVDFQHDYFVDGDESKLRPMVLKDIAEITGFDISTISRVVNSKYIETHFGVYKLKYFFSEGIADKSGEEVSTRGLKKVLQELVDAEDKQHPLADEKLSQMMQERGYNIARRTIAKYRDQLGIPSAHLRRDL